MPDTILASANPLSLTAGQDKVGAMESAIDYYTARALLDWQIELGVTETIGDSPVDRYALPDTTAKPKQAEPGVIPIKPAAEDPAAVAQKLALKAGSLEDLKAAMAGFELCELKKGARNLVFGGGNPAAKVMIIGEAPGREEDRAGRPFVGSAGSLLDKMLAAINLNRETSVYITTVLPWRPPQNRDPRPDEIGMLKPFLERHIELVQPDVLVLMGNISCQAILGKRGITRLRGKWEQALKRPVLPMLSPEQLLRQPQAKRQAWADLLELQAKLKTGT